MEIHWRSGGVPLDELLYYFVGAPAAFLTVAQSASPGEEVFRVQNEFILDTVDDFRRALRHSLGQAPLQRWIVEAEPKHAVETSSVAVIKALQIFVGAPGRLIASSGEKLLTRTALAAGERLVVGRAFGPRKEAIDHFLGDSSVGGVLPGSAEASERGAR